jgi:hypothetical protein
MDQENESIVPLRGPMLAFRTSIAVSVETEGFSRSLLTVGLGETARASYDNAMNRGVLEFWRKL